MSNQTAGFRLTHIGFSVSNLDQSVRFYTNALGMTEIGRMSLETTTIAFLAYPDAALEGITPFAREGVLELVCANNPSRAASKMSNRPDSRFAKLCFSVPDVAKAMEYIKSCDDVRVVKDVGEFYGSDEVAKFLGTEDPDKGFDAQFWELAKQVAFVQDPDGYLIEIVPNYAQLG